MLGALITIAFSLGMCGLARRCFARMLDGLDPALRLGLAGLFGLAVTGWITLPVGLVPGGLAVGLYIVGGLALIGLALSLSAREDWRFSKPDGWMLGVAAAIAIACVVAIINVLGPVDSFEWDSLAYHLAVPKLRIDAGQIYWIQTIHHSNFPALVDNLFIWGLQWGGTPGAKAFSLMYVVFGTSALFGMARERYGEKAAWWTVLAFVSMPAVMWEMGTAYIDVSHGLWAGLGILFAAEFFQDPEKKNRLWLCVICLGLAAASKYTGLQVAIAVALVLFFGFVIRKQSGVAFKSAALCGIGALAICSPWLIRNFENTGNPVYPFFYEVFHGKNWSPFHAEIYKNEQQTFGVGRTEIGRDWSQFPHAVIGLAYQPGRYTNRNQTEGGGFPTGSIGFVAIAAALCWMFSRRIGRFEASVLATIGICFIIWFALSQQSRYALNMAIPLCVLAGGFVARNRTGPVLAAAVVVQFGYSLWVVKTVIVDSKLPVLAGKLSQEDYLSQTVPIYANAQTINSVDGVRRVALFDEVFGYYLSKPYIWANPGHSTIIPYDKLHTGNDFVEALKQIGVSHVYVSFAQEPAGLLGRAFRPLREGVERPQISQEEIDGAFNDPQQKWKALILWAARDGELQLAFANGAGALFEIAGR